MYQLLQSLEDKLACFKNNLNKISARNEQAKLDIETLQEEMKDNRQTHQETQNEV